MVASQHMNKHGLFVVGEPVKNSECGFLNPCFVVLQFY